MEKPFLEHLEDLRKMVVSSVVVVGVATVGCLSFHKQIFGLILYPKDIAGVAVTMTTLAPGEGFAISMKCALTAGVIFSFPFVLFFVLQFILPGLRRTERRVLWPAIAVGVGLFLTGAVFAYFVLVPQMLTFFRDWDAGLGITDTWRVEYYVRMVTSFVLFSGLAFELPVLVMALVKLEVLTFRVMNENRRIALLAVAVSAAVITPSTDVLSLVFLAGPMYLLYEVCIWLAFFLERKARRENPDLYVDEADVVVKDDWDHEGYNPWEEITREEEVLPPVDGGDDVKDEDGRERMYPYDL